MTTDPAVLLDLAVRAARAAGRELLSRYGDVQGLATKSSVTDPVTDADRASERLLAEIITAERPQDGLLGEEGADRPSESGLIWVVDPLDGTVNYLYELGNWAVSVAVEDEAGAVVGVVHDPVADRTFTAFRGGGDGGPADLDVDVPDVADDGVEHPGDGLEGPRDQRCDGVRLRGLRGLGEPVAGGGVQGDGASGELHGRHPPPDNGQPPGCSAALYPRSGELHAGRLDNGRRPGGRVTVRFSLAAVRRTGGMPSLNCCGSSTTPERAAHLDGG